jgi:hypothetical protein
MAREENRPAQLSHEVSSCEQTRLSQWHKMCTQEDNPPAETGEDQRNSHERKWLEREKKWP